VGYAGSGREQGGGSDQGGKNAFHDVTPLQRLVSRSDAIDERKDIDSVIAEKHRRPKDNFSVFEIIEESGRADLGLIG
jgi:hypothetical protein